MNSIRMPVVGAAALAAMITAAQADDLELLKAEIEALNARVAQLEKAPLFPPEYKLLSITQVEGIPLEGEMASDYVGGLGTMTSIGILPTADAPAMASVVWSGEIRTRLTYVSNRFDRFFEDVDNITVNVRGRIRVAARTDTAVGEVGSQLRLEGKSEFDGGAPVEMNIAWGWWQMTPDWQFAGGYNASLSNVPFGQHEYMSYGSVSRFTTGDNEQLRLTYASGPMTWAVAVEDPTGNEFYGDLCRGCGGTVDVRVDGGVAPAIASRLLYRTDSHAAGISGFYQPNDDATITRTGGFPQGVVDIADSWQIGAGAETQLGDSLFISAGAAIGRGGLDAGRFLLFGLPRAGFPRLFDTEYWNASIYARFDLSDVLYTEASLGYANVKTDPFDGSAVGVAFPHYDADIVIVNGAIIYQPVDELAFGLQADYVDRNISNTDAVNLYSDKEVFSASLVSWLRF